MIVVLGSPRYRPGSTDRPSGVAGLAAGIAAAATGAGAAVQLVGRVGEDPAGDATLLALTDLGIGHVATLRDAARPTPVEPAPIALDPDLVDDVDPFMDPADGSPDDGTSIRPGATATLDPDDVGLALRYLDGYRVIVVADALSRPGLDAAAEAAAYGGARLVVIVAGGGHRHRGATRRPRRRLRPDRGGVRRGARPGHGPRRSARDRGRIGGLGAQCGLTSLRRRWA